MYWCLWSLLSCFLGNCRMVSATEVFFRSLWMFPFLVYHGALTVHCRTLFYFNISELFLYCFSWSPHIIVEFHTLLLFPHVIIVGKVYTLLTNPIVYIRLLLWEISSLLLKCGCLMTPLFMIQDSLCHKVVYLKNFVLVSFQVLFFLGVCLLFRIIMSSYFTGFLAVCSLYS